jgi:hypothetical protein
MFLDEVNPFLAHYGPCEIKDKEVDDCISSILSNRNSLLTETGNQLSWTEYHLTEPAEYDATENVAFQPLGRIIEKIMQRNPRKPKKRLHFKLCPDNWLTGDIDGGKFKIDACFTETNQPNAISNRRIFLPIELKQERTIRLRMLVCFVSFGGLKITEILAGSSTDSGRVSPHLKRRPTPDVDFRCTLIALYRSHITNLIASLPSKMMSCPFGTSPGLTR